MGKLWWWWWWGGGGGGGGEDKHLLGEGLLGGFSQVGEGLPQSFPVGKPIYIYTIVPAGVLIPLANHNPAIFLSPKVLKNLKSCPRQTKSCDNSNVLLMLNNNTYIDPRTASRHVLIPSYFIQMI